MRLFQSYRVVGEPCHDTEAKYLPYTLCISAPAGMEIYPCGMTKE